MSVRFISSLGGTSCLWLACAAVAVACDSGGGGSGKIATKPDERSPSTAAPPPTDTKSDLADTSGEAQESAFDLYDPETLPKFELTFDAPAMAILSSTDPAQEKTWVHGAFTMGDIHFEDVGVRRKGQSSFRALPGKSGLKVKFNKWVKGQKLHGLSEITLNNMVNDPTFLTERLAYHVYRSLGLPAERANSAHLSINGEDYGVYANVETPNAAFLQRVFGAKANTLYEVELYGSEWLPGMQDGFKIDVADKTAPPGTRPDLDRLFDAVKVANNDTLIADLEGHLHTTQWLRYSATEGAIGAYDGYGYGFFGGSANYFMAGDTDGRFSIIPWSTEATFTDNKGVVNADAPHNNPVQTVLARCRSATSCWSSFKTEMRSVLAVYRTLDLVNLAKKWNAQIDALVRADPKRERGLDDYEYSTNLLYDWIAARPNIVESQLGL